MVAWAGVERLKLRLYQPPPRINDPDDPAALEKHVQVRGSGGLGAPCLARRACRADVLRRSVGRPACRAVPTVTAAATPTC